jgi:hypothetical protein
MSNFKNCPFSFSVNELIALIEANKNREISPKEGERIIKRLYNAGGPVRANEIFWFEIVCKEIRRLFDIELTNGYNRDYYTYERETFNFAAENAEYQIKFWWMPNL